MSEIPTSILNKDFFIWITKNRTTFILVLLAAANVYQYVDRSNHDMQCDADKRILNEQLQKIISDDVDRERRRSEKLEFLIQNFPKVSLNNGNSNPSANSTNSTSSTGTTSTK
jgi:hypothetical protein